MKEKIDQYCRTCVNRKIDFHNATHGIICNLNQKEPDFEPTCPHFVIDKEQSLNIKNRGIVEPKTRIITGIIDLVAIIVLYNVLVPLILGAIMMTLFSGLSVVLAFLLYLSLGFTIVFMGYYLLMEGFFGKTLGKFITKTKVVTTNHEKPSFKSIVTRGLCRLLPFVNLFRERGSRIYFHDKMSETIVVKG